MLINSVNHSFHLSRRSHNLSYINVNQLNQPPSTSQLMHLVKKKVMIFMELNDIS